MIATCGHPLAKPSPHHKGANKTSCALVNERELQHAISVARLVVRLHSIVRDGHRAGCEAQTEGCRVMGVMEWIADEQLNEFDKLLRGGVGSSASRGSSEVRRWTSELSNRSSGPRRGESSRVEARRVEAGLDGKVES